MKRLYIIGNGMDIDHGLNTRWTDIFTEGIRKHLKFISNKIEFTFDEAEKNPLWHDFEKRISHISDLYINSFLSDDDLLEGFKESIKNKEYVFDDVKNLLRNKLKLWFEKFEQGRLDDVNRSKKEEVFFKKNKLMDFTHFYIRTIIKHIKKIDTKNTSKLHKYEKLFRETKDYFVINYNYTIFNTDLFKYYSKKKEFHIHGVINDKTEFVDRSKTKKDKNEILLGLYSRNSPLIIEEFDPDITSSVPKKNIEEFLKKIGNKRNNFIKYFKNNAFKTEWKEIKDIDSIDEVVVIGHSLSGNDLPFLSRTYKMHGKNIRLNPKKVIWYTYFENNNDLCDLFSKLKNIFNNAKNYRIINNKNDKEYNSCE